MEYGFEINESVDAAVKRVARAQISLAIHDANDPALDRHEVVHRIRKRCKKQRALIRLVRPSLADTFGRDNAFYRELSRNLSSLRDTQALLECFDRTIDHFAATIDRDEFAPIRSFLIDRRDECTENKARLVRLTETTTSQLEHAIGSVQDWKIDSNDFNAVAPGLEKTYRRACKAMRQVRKQPETERLHEWRKRVKYHGYHADLLARIAPGLLGAHGKLAEQLGTLLGEDHDLAVLKATLFSTQFSTGGPTAVNNQCLARLRILVETRQLQLQSDALELGRILLAEKPRHLVRRWNQYWLVARETQANAT
ncbi:MAG: CHAD domain-containing protein [Pirellulaceae bacterium]|nr:CHAD domain-containing protein [Pirellulaceae bacterium]